MSALRQYASTVVETPDLHASMEEIVKEEASE
jgi:hypothetical protein